MADSKLAAVSIFDINKRTGRVGLVLLFLFALTVAALPARTQTLSTLHSFHGGRQGLGPDGGYPKAGLTIDRAGNLYGTTSGGGSFTSVCSGLGCGTVFKIALKGSNWVISPLYNFQGGTDGQVPATKVILGPDGSLYGTTQYGGQGYCGNLGPGCGVVFNLRPPPAGCRAVPCLWQEKVLYSFAGGTNGGLPTGEVTFDQAGNLYGAAGGGAYGFGMIYKLTPSHGSWTESAVYSFMGPPDGESPWGAVIADAAGNLYGTTAAGGSNYCPRDFSTCGTVYELSPTQSGWTETILHSFQGDADGAFPFSGLTPDSSGNLYGSTDRDGPNGGGTIFELAPSGGAWVFSLVYGLTGSDGGPQRTLVLDQAGNLYGAATGGGAHGQGSVFKLTLSNGSWLYTDLHDFTGGGDGSGPYDGLALDSQGNIYGTTEDGGTYAEGTVFEITP